MQRKQEQQLRETLIERAHCSAPGGEPPVTARVPVTSRWRLPFGTIRAGCYRPALWCRSAKKRPRSCNGLHATSAKGASHRTGRYGKSSDTESGISLQRGVRGLHGTDNFCPFGLVAARTFRAVSAVQCGRQPRMQRATYIIRLGWDSPQRASLTCGAAARW